MEILVTGGTGFLGRVLTHALLQQGHGVRVLGRTVSAWSSRDPLQFAKLYRGDVRRPETLREAAAGCDAICHAAGILPSLHRKRDVSAAMWSIHKEGTENICLVAAEAEVPHFVQIGSIAVYGSDRGQERKEQDECRPEDDYARSKLAAEEAACKVARSEGLSLTILRLSALYGPGHQGNVHRLLSAMARGRFWPIGDGGNRKNLLHVADAARACRLVLERGPQTRETEAYNVAGPTLTMREILDAAAVAVGRKPYRFYLPAGPLAILARQGLAPRALARWLADDAVDSSSFRNTYGWEPRIELRMGFEEEARSVVRCALPRQLEQRAGS